METAAPSGERPRTLLEILSNTGRVHEFRRPSKVDVRPIIHLGASKLPLIEALHCLDELPRRCIQRLYGYRSLRAMRISEIAELEGMSVGRVKTAIKQAMELLALIVEENEFEPSGELFYDDRRLHNSDELDWLRPGHEYNDLLAPRCPDDSFGFPEIRKRAPGTSGCYAWIDGLSGEVLRIGKAKSLWFRLIEYPKDCSRAVLLMFQWLEEHRNILESLQIKIWKQRQPDLLEVSLLQEFRPRFNVMHGSLPFERTGER